MLSSFEKKLPGHDRLVPLTNNDFPHSALHFRIYPWLLLSCHSPADTKIMVLHAVQGYEGFYCANFVIT